MKVGHMDFWNRKKVADLEWQVSSLREQRDNLLSDIERLETRMRGERVCGGHCQKCKHGFQAEVPQYVGVGWYNPWMCLLDCKCKDFEQK